MKRHHLIPLMIALPLLAACNNKPSDPPAPPASGNSATVPQTALGRGIDAAMQKAREEMLKGNIDLNDGIRVKPGVTNIHVRGDAGSDGLPKAEITPQGDLLIEGNTVAIDEAQRKLLLNYRGQIIDIAATGMAIGVQGADLGMRAAGEAMKGIFTGNTDQIEKNIKAEAEKLKAQAHLICQRLSPLLATQQRLASSLPEFQPYARIKQKDIDDCMKDLQDGVAVFDDSKTKVEIQSEIRDGIQQGIRSAIQGVSSATGTGATASLDGVQFLLPAGNVSVQSNNGVGNINVGNGMLIDMERGQMSVNGVRYAKPARVSIVNLRESGKILVDGMVVEPLG